MSCNTTADVAAISESDESFPLETYIPGGPAVLNVVPDESGHVTFSYKFKGETVTYKSLQKITSEILTKAKSSGVLQRSGVAERWAEWNGKFPVDNESSRILFTVQTTLKLVTLAVIHITPDDGTTITSTKGTWSVIVLPKGRICVNWEFDCPMKDMPCFFEVFCPGISQFSSVRVSVNPDITADDSVSLVPTRTLKMGKIQIHRPTRKGMAVFDSCCENKQGTQVIHIYSKRLCSEPYPETELVLAK